MLALAHLNKINTLNVTQTLQSSKTYILQKPYISICHKMLIRLCIFYAFLFYDYYVFRYLGFVYFVSLFFHIVFFVVVVFVVCLPSRVQ